MSRAETMEKNYNPLASEKAIYETWESKGYFHEEPDPARKPFTIMMPPPNITGQLHLGHALQGAVQDAITRYKRMRGFCTLYLPGTDHASIATEVRIIETLAKEGISKQELGREGFLKRAWDWKKQYGGRIVEQLRSLGVSCDWKRERFTMDEGNNAAVVEVFNRLYEKGLIYQGHRIINWCPVCKTALSDAEVEYESQDGHLWHIRYPLEDGSGEIVVATTRPETMLGDTAVAVHPDDPRYAAMVGKMLILPLVGRRIPVVADSYVEMEFGSGAVKITPAHDPNDYEVGQRHGLEQITVMHEDGTMNENAGAYQGMTAQACRKQLVEDLQAQGFLVRVEDYAHNVGTCYRCHTTVEPMLSKQWFVSMQSLADAANREVRAGKTRFIPDRYSRVYFSYMDNIRDWCISRQLWWGHRIPAWHCQDCGEVTVSRTEVTACPKCGGAVRQDEDVLDTWFSSALWPFATLGWPQKTPDLDYFYPTSLLVTAYDIIFFWVARMIFSGVEQMGEVPFPDVLITGIVRDAQGRKMSKSLGNGIDPLEVIQTYGADALRFALTMGTTPGNDMRYSQEKIEAARNFSNKIWNASRFVLMGLGDAPVKSIDEVELEPIDGWILTRLGRLIREVTDHMEGYELGMATGKVYDFIWSTFCDWYIEWAKQRLYSDDETKKEAVRAVLIHVLERSLILMHPFMPFVTEKIWDYIPGREEGSLIMASWPEDHPLYHRDEDEEAITAAMDIIRAIRNIRAEMKVPQGKRTRVLILPAHQRAAQSLPMNASAMEKLAYAQSVEFITDKQQVPKGAVGNVCDWAEVFLPLEDLVDIEKEKARLGKEREKLSGDIARAEAKLANPGFTGKAPAAVVEKERENLALNREKLTRLDAQLAALEG